MFQKSSQTTFFQSIAMVDMERFHSAILKWVLTDCQALDYKAKCELLHTIFEANKLNPSKIVFCENEWQNIDLIVMTEDGHVWVLENKIKCEEHDDQLKRYCEQIFSENILKWKRKEDGQFSKEDTNDSNQYPCQNITAAHFAFLTLLKREDNYEYEIDGKAESVRWTPIAYGDVLSALGTALENSSCCVDKQILEGYVAATSDLIKKAEQAIGKPEMLFSNKVKDDEGLYQFIEKFKLKRLLQRYYFHSIKNRVLEETNKKKDNIIRNLGDKVEVTFSIQSGARSGTAEMSFSIRNAIKNPQDAVMGIQLQDNTFKIDVSLDYFNKKAHEKNREELRANGWLREKNEQIETCFDQFVKNNKQENWHVNLPKGGYPRMSISKKMAKNEDKDHLEAIINGFNECLGIAQELLNKEKIIRFH